MVFTESSAKSAKSAGAFINRFVISTKEKSIKYNHRDAFSMTNVVSDCLNAKFLF